MSVERTTSVRASDAPRRCIQHALAVHALAVHALINADAARAAHAWAHRRTEAAPHADWRCAAMATAPTWSGKSGAGNDYRSADQCCAQNVAEHEISPFLQRLGCSADSTQPVAKPLRVIHVAYSFARWAVPSRRRATPIIACGHENKVLPRRAVVRSRRHRRNPHGTYDPAARVQL